MTSYRSGFVQFVYLKIRQTRLKTLSRLSQLVVFHLSRHIGTAAAPNRIDRSRFNFGDSPALKLRRLRSKSPMPFGGQAPATPIMPASSPHDPDQDAGDEMDIADPANEHEMEVAEGDEDAARFLHG